MLMQAGFVTGIQLEKENLSLNPSLSGREGL